MPVAECGMKQTTQSLFHMHAQRSADDPDREVVLQPVDLGLSTPLDS